MNDDDIAMIEAAELMADPDYSPENRCYFCNNPATGRDEIGPDRFADVCGMHMW